MHPLPALPPGSAAATAEALLGRGSASSTSAAARTAAVAAATAASASADTDDALAATWRLAYLVTGNRALAHRIADELLATGLTDPVRLRAAVLARARAERRRGDGVRGSREALWSVLQRLPRRDRAAIVARLSG